MVQDQKIIEEQAPTVEEAVQAGLEKLGLSEEAVDIEIVDEGRRGLFGMGGRDAVVRLRPRSRPEAAQPKPDQEKRAAPKEAAAPRVDDEAAPSKKQTAPQVERQRETKEVESAAEVDEQDTAVAQEVIESLLQRMGVVATIEATLSPPDDLTGRQMTIFNISGEDLGLLIGARGETLDALQHLARLMVGHQLKRRANFVVDVEGYRARRQQALSRLAERMGKKAVDRGRPVTLEAMPAYERRIIHMTLRENPQVRTESTGEGDRRRVRIYPL